VKAELPSESDAAASSKVVRKALESCGMPFGRMYLNIPRHLVTIRFLKLPSVDEEEIQKMARIESLKHIPYTEEGVVTGYRVVEKLDSGYSNVLLAIVKHATVKRFIDALSSAGIAGVKSTALSSESLFLWYLEASSSKRGNILLADIELDRVDIDVIEGERLVFARGVANDGMLSVEKITEEIRISAEAYEKESGKKLEKVVLSGVASRAKECAAFLAKESSIPVEILEEMSNIPADEGVAGPTDASFVELIGLALKGKSAKIDLTPEEIVKENSVSMARKRTGLTAALLAFLILLLLGLAAKKLFDKWLTLSRIDTELKTMEPKVAKVKRMAKELEIIKSEMTRKPLAIDVIKEVHRLTPEGVSFSMLEFESGKSLKLKGTALSLGDVFKYVTILEGSPYFESAKVRYAAKRAMPSGEIADFEINCVLSKVK
jgi:Tfp pilus assembly PilM family ATPase